MLFWLVLGWVVVSGLALLLVHGGAREADPDYLSDQARDERRAELERLQQGFRRDAKTFHAFKQGDRR